MVFYHIYIFLYLYLKKSAGQFQLTKVYCIRKIFHISKKIFFYSIRVISFQILHEIIRTKLEEFIESHTIDYSSKVLEIPFKMTVKIDRV